MGQGSPRLPSHRVTRCSPPHQPHHLDHHPQRRARVLRIHRVHEDSPPRSLGRNPGAPHAPRRRQRNLKGRRPPHPRPRASLGHCHRHPRARQAGDQQTSQAHRQGGHSPRRRLGHLGNRITGSDARRPGSEVYGPWSQGRWLSAPRGVPGYELPRCRREGTAAVGLVLDSGCVQGGLVCGLY